MRLGADVVSATVRAVGPARILLAEDASLLRQAFVAQLSAEPAFEVVSQVERGDRVLAHACVARPDIAVLDVEMPGMDGLAAAELLRTELPSCQVLFITGYGRPGVLRQALRVGGRGVLLKTSPQSLVDGVHEVLAGRRVIDPQLMVDALEDGECPLTERERDVLSLTADGCAPTEIAERLCLSPGTVRNNLSSVVAKLRARTKVDAVLIAWSSGWIRRPHLPSRRFPTA